jgi:hypothetical protein
MMKKAAGMNPFACGSFFRLGSEDQSLIVPESFASIPIAITAYVFPAVTPLMQTVAENGWIIGRSDANGATYQAQTADPPALALHMEKRIISFLRRSPSALDLSFYEIARI